MNGKYEWAIEDIYKTQSDWEKDYNDVKEKVDFTEYKGKLSDPKVFLSCMQKQEQLGRVLEKLSIYAMMRHDVDTADSNADALVSKIEFLYSKFSQEIAFVSPELTSLKTAQLKEYISLPELKDYDYMLKCILKSKAHVLSEKEEKLLAESGETLSTFKEIFTKIDNADLPLPTITHKGDKYQLSHGLYGVLMHDTDRALRKKCFKSYYNAYISMINTISSTYYGNVKKDVFVSKARHYDSCLSRALFCEDVDPKVYHNLTSSVIKALPLLHRYMREKKKALNLKTMHMYDVYVPTTENAELKLSYEEAFELVIKGLSPLGKDYENLLKKARDSRWISVFETKNKKSGAYSVAVYDTHPYVLLNYQKTTHDVFTIAHELGHSIHSYFSNKNQPYFKADYKIFVAEVASTVNEVLLIKYLINTATDKKLKKYLLSYLLEMIRTTLFRQTQFAEFEEFTHGEVEKGEPLTKDKLCEKYLEINKKYYGKSVVSDDEIKYEWARIPHFYRSFYVYKYATGIISALAIADKILNEGEEAVKNYFKFLSSGDSDGPVELLKIAGVDLTKKQPFVSAFKTFSDALKQFIIL
ncbi:MAG: oligoendopeptidase F [Clostridia bacterium]|nr:oligoendopeptidase F [Clostridia bacterium]